MISKFARRPVNLLRRFLSKDGAHGYEIGEHLNHFRRCLEFVGYNAVDGDLLEFGVGRGATLAMLNNIAGRALTDKNNLPYRIFGFDSFEGLPEPDGSDKDMHVRGPSGLKFTKGAFSSSEDEVWKTLQRESSRIDNIQLVRGWYEQTLSHELRQRLDIKKASFINVDCDFYASAKVVLDWCECLIDQGTIISFDDWFCYKGSTNHGEALAFSEFLEEHPDLTAKEFSNCSWHGKAFVMSRTNR